MGALRQAWATIVRQLGGLSGKDKALIGSLVVVGIMALVLVGLWSSKPSMVPLLPDTSPGDQAAAAAALTEADIEHTNKGGKVYVTPEKRMYALAYLQQAGKLPEKTDSLFAALSQGENWMSSARDSDRRANAALCDVLSRVISNFKGVERATVMIDAPESLGIGVGYRKPTASVAVMLKQGRALDSGMVDAIAGMVKGAKAGLEMDNIRVIDQRGGQQYVPRTGNSLGGIGIGGGEDYASLTAKHEASIQRKVSDVVSRYDPLSIVTVSVQADNTAKRTTINMFLPMGKGSVGIEESNSKDGSDDRSSGGGGGAGGANGPPAAPGVTSNVPQDINTGSGSGSASKRETETTKSKVGLGTKFEDVVAPGGMATRVSVMVSLSREYMINLIRTKKGPAAAGAAGSGGGAATDEPTQADIDTAFTAEKDRLEKDLKGVVQATAVEPNESNIPRVTVSLIPVMQLGMSGMGGGSGGGGAMASMGGGGPGGGLMSQLTSGQTIRTGFLGLLAFVALGMMLMLVRKSSKPQSLPTPEELAGLPPVMEAGDDVVGEADEGATAMVGIELGETQIKTKKMVESIEELVKKTPLDAAALMNRWLNVER